MQTEILNYIRKYIIYVVIGGALFLGYKYVYVYKGSTYNPQEEKAVEEKAKALGWTKFSAMEVDPWEEEEKPWDQRGGFALKQLNNGILTVETRWGQTGHFVLLDDRLDNALGTTAEIRASFSKTPTNLEYHDAAMFGLQDGAREGKISFLPDRILIYDQNDLNTGLQVNTRDFHTYRMVIFKDKMKVYVDQLEIAAIKLSNKVEGKMIFWGDTSNNENANFGAEVLYVCYRTGK